MRVFLSYRRSDTRDFSARLADRLRSSPDVSDVFLDVTKIEPGERFPQRLTDALRSSDFVLIVIGKNWTGGTLSNALGGDEEEGVATAHFFVR